MDERSPGDAPPVTGLLERSDVMNELDGMLAGIATTGGQAVLVWGEAGIGKSALVRRFLERHEADARPFARVGQHQIGWGKLRLSADRNTGQ